MNATQFRAWVLPEIGAALRLEQRAVPILHPQGVLVRVEAAMVLSYIAKVLDGSIPYALPELPFVPGTNAVGTVEAVGAEVAHVAPGERVILSPHVKTDEPGLAPDQILIGLTAMGNSRFGGVAEGALKLQRVWRDGVYAERVQWPASCVTPLRGVDHVPPHLLMGIAKLVIPYGGLLRAGVRAGDVVAINGASGFFGSAGVVAALAMGASRVVAIGRNAATLAELAGKLGPRVRPVALAGADMAADIAAIREAADGPVDRALDMLGQASTASSTGVTLRSLRRGGRLVLMGSCAQPLTVDFGEMLGNDWEVVGNFMYPKHASASLAALVASGQIDLSVFDVKSFPLTRLPEAIAAASTMCGLEMTVVEPGA
jgi:alcohol dehydrogenase